jgi:hypothetical protein
MKQYIIPNGLRTSTNEKPYKPGLTSSHASPMFILKQDEAGKNDSSRLEFHGADVSSDGGLLANQDLDQALGKTVMAQGLLRDDEDCAHLALVGAEAQAIQSWLIRIKAFTIPANGYGRDRVFVAEWFRPRFSLGLCGPSLESFPGADYGALSSLPRGSHLWRETEVRRHSFQEGQRFLLHLPRLPSNASRPV